MGNGDGSSVADLVIEVTPLRSDWVVIRPALSDFRKIVELERLPLLLDKTLVTWLGNHPKVEIQSSLGLVENGFTVAIHLWLKQPI